jgi:hypothetical protein
MNQMAFYLLPQLRFQHSARLGVARAIPPIDPGMSYVAWSIATLPLKRGGGVKLPRDPLNVSKPYWHLLSRRGEQTYA